MDSILHKSLSGAYTHTCIQYGRNNYGIVHYTDYRPRYTFSCAQFSCAQFQQHALRLFFVGNQNLAIGDTIHPPECACKY